LDKFIKYYPPAKFLKEEKMYDETFKSLISIIYTRIEKFVLIFYGGDLNKDKLPNH